MVREQINVRLSSDLLDRIDKEGKRSDVVRKALDFYFSEDKRLSGIDKSIDKKLDRLIEDVEEIKRFQPVINVHYPDRLLPGVVEKDRKKGFWNRFFH